VTYDAIIFRNLNVFIMQKVLVPAVHHRCESKNHAVHYLSRIAIIFDVFSRHDIEGRVAKGGDKCVENPAVQLKTAVWFLLLLWFLLVGRAAYCVV
jgi:hypothetical protein